MNRIFRDIADKMKLDVNLGSGEIEQRVSGIFAEKGEGTESGTAHEGFFEVSYQAMRMEENGHLFLIPADIHYNHHYGTDEVFATAIEKLDKEPEYLMNPKDAARMGVEEGDQVTLETDTGSLSITPILSGDVKEGHMVVKSHYRKTGIQALFPYELDKETKTPVTGFVRVKLQKP